MIKVTFKTPGGVYWAICERMRYVRGSGYFMESVIEDSDSHVPGEWTKTPESWRVLLVEEA